MSIQSEISRINDAKVDIVQAAVNFGLEVPAGSQIGAYSEAILAYSQSPAGSKYVQAFTGQTTVTITAATHGCGETPWVDVYILEGENYTKTQGYPTEGYKITITATGDVTVTFTASTSGRIIIG